MTRLVGLLLLVGGILGCSAPPAVVLDIYWIDVEGGASTLAVTADRRSALMDTGYAGFDERDTDRIEHVIREEAGLDRLDYVLTSHFHGDHMGGLAPLAARIDVDAFVDHGDSVEQGTEGGAALWQTYLSATGNRRNTVGVGDRLLLGGIELVIVSAHGNVLEQRLAGEGPNTFCSTYQEHPVDAGENGRSLGYVLRAGDFEFVNLGDLSWNFQGQLACPVNVLGDADIFQATHHGTRDDVVPAQMWAMAPTVAVMNNGPTKGAGAEAVATVMQSPGLGDFWQLHRATANDATHNAPDDTTANLGPTEACEGAWLHARLFDDGTYTMTNSRNGYTKTYRVK